MCTVSIVLTKSKRWDLNLQLLSKNPITLPLLCQLVILQSDYFYSFDSEDDASTARLVRQPVVRLAPLHRRNVPIEKPLLESGQLTCLKARSD